MGNILYIYNEIVDGTKVGGRSSSLLELSLKKRGIITKG